MGVLFSSHQLDLVEHLCHSVAIVHAGRVVAAGPVEELTSVGPGHLVVGVDGDAGGAWASAVPGVRLEGRAGRDLRLVLDDGVDPQSVLAAALRAGPVSRFGFERRRLSEVFRQAVGARPWVWCATASSGSPFARRPCASPPP